MLLSVYIYIRDRVDITSSLAIRRNVSIKVGYTSKSYVTIGGVFPACCIKKERTNEQLAAEPILTPRNAQRAITIIIDVP